MNSKDLFAPMELKGFKLKNRLGVAPMTRMASPEASLPRPDVLDFLIRRAENGAALIYNEGIVTDNLASQGYPRQCRLLEEHQIDAWKRATDGIRQHGAISVCQLFHCGRVSWPLINPAGRVLAPSPIPARAVNRFTEEPYPIPEQMSHTDIVEAVEGFRLSAEGAIRAGFDGVEIHGAHGYLVSEFISPLTNHRDDQYGGDSDKRFRFAREVLRAIRSTIPVDKLVIFRISDWSRMDPGMSLFGDAEEWKRVIRMISDEMVDAISVSTQNFADKAFDTELNMAQVTREATDLPILICGGVYDRTTASAAIEDADVVLSARTALLNPDWVMGIERGWSMEPVTDKEAARAYTDEMLP